MKRTISDFFCSLISRCSRFIVPIFVALLFFGAMVWAKSEDPFVRKWFRVKTASFGKVECVAVVPKVEAGSSFAKASTVAKALADRTADKVADMPVVFYLHGLGGSLMTDGRALRQMAELGMVTVSVEYNQTNYAAFEEQFLAVLEEVNRKERRERKDGGRDSLKAGLHTKVAWVGDGLGAQNALKFFLKHPDQRPDLLVQLGGGWVPELEEFNHKERREHKEGKFLATDVTDSTDGGIRRTEFLLVHGERDEVFPVEECRKVAEALLKWDGRGKGEPRNTRNTLKEELTTSSTENAVTSIATNRVDLKVLPGLGHSLEPDRALVIRQVGEYVRAHLTPKQPLPEFPAPPCYPFWVCAMPAFLWAGFWAAKRRKNRIKIEEDRSLPPLAKWEIGLRVVAGVLAAWAAAETAIHLIPPRLEVSERTLQIARWKLLAPKWQEDFSVLERMPIWKGQRLKTLLTHVELAHYCVYELINWKLPPEIYQNYVLSPVIEGSEREMEWRRPLWEFYYPRIRKENTTESAAIIVARTLRERITIWPGFDRPQGIDTIWKEQITGEKGFEKIYVATLRSVGVPARLDSTGKAEFWDGEKWRGAPGLAFESYLMKKDF